MEKEKKVFKPGPNCFDEETCRILGSCGSCFEAHILKVEMGYEKKRPGLSALENRLLSSNCQHPQASKRREEARKVLGQESDDKIEIPQADKL